MNLSCCTLNASQEEYKTQLLHKWNNDPTIICCKIPASKGNQGGGKNREIIMINDIYYVTDTCKKCDIRMALYCFPKYPTKRSKNPLEVVSGYESCDMRCISCRKYDAKKRSQEQTEIMRQMIKKDNGDLTEVWVQTQLEQQHNRCDITNLPITLERGYYYSASVQNNAEGKLHYQANCVLIMVCLQVQEHGIINLKDAWKRVFYMMKEIEELKSDSTQFLEELDVKFTNTRKQNGVTAPVQIIEDNKKKKNPEYSSQSSKLHLPAILRIQCERYYIIDIKSKGRKNKTDIVKLKPKDIMNKLHSQDGRCYLSGVPFSFNINDPNYWSLERIDNKKHHTVENTVLVCRIMNGRVQLTKEIIQKMYNEYKSL